MLVVAAVIDVRTRRIPNWLTVPFLISGLAFHAAAGGQSGAVSSLAGFGLALLLFGPPCFMRAMGMGDLKLAAAVGAWIGPSQFVVAFIVTGIVGGVIAAGYALWNRSLGRCLDNTGELLLNLAKGRSKAHADIRDGASRKLSIPYAPAIATGTLFSFFAQ